MTGLPPTHKNLSARVHLRLLCAWANRCPLCLIYPTHGKERRQW